MTRVRNAVLLTVAGLLSACSDNPTRPRNTEFQLASNGRQIDSTTTPLLSDSAQLSNGVLVFPASADIKVGQVIAGTQSGGYLRRVTSVATDGGVLTAQSENASLSELVKRGGFSFEHSATEGGTGVASEARVVASGSGPAQLTLTDFTIFDGEICIPGSTPPLCGTLRFHLDELSVDFDSRIEFAAAFDNGLDTLALRVRSTLESRVSAVVALGVEGQGDFTFDHLDTLYTHRAPFSVPGPLPVVGYTVYRLIVGVEVRGGVSAELRGEATSSVSGDVELEYNDGTWSTSKNFDAAMSGDASGSVGADVSWRVFVRPDVALVMYGVLGPFATAAGYIDVQHRTNLADDSFADTATAGVEASIGLRRDLVISSATLFEKHFDPIELRVFARTGTRRLARQLVVESGDDGVAWRSSALASPLVARVLDRIGRGVPDVEVTFSSEDGGSLEPSSAITDSDGRAQAIWTLGSRAGPQVARAFASGPAGVSLVPSGLEFSATATDSLMRVSITSANPATGQLGGAIESPLRVLVVDASGIPIPGVEVRLSSNDGALVEPASVVSSLDGTADASVILGGSAGYQSVAAIAEVAVGTPFFVVDTAVLHAAVPLQASSLAVGRSHVCALVSGGRVACWGANSNGQLGRGLEEAGDHRARLIDGSQEFSAIASAEHHVCGVAGTSVLCWGDGASGKLGSGHNDDISVPTPVSGSRLYASVAVGRDHSCALTTGRAAFCWGDNGDGELGSGSAAANAMTPQAVSGGHQFLSLALGESFTCGLRTDHRVYCWGDGSQGKLGTGGTSDANTPQPVQGGLEFEQIVAGQDHVCALTATGATYCWGNNSAGMAGAPDELDDLTAPRLVDGGHSFVSLGSGRQHTCGVKAGGEVWCWGDNNDGQLGLGAVTLTSNVHAPQRVLGSQSFQRVISGSYSMTTCAIATASQTVYCWGLGDLGQHGYPGTLGNRLEPTVVPRP